MEKLLGILQKQDGFEVTDDLKSELQKVWDGAIEKAQEKAREEGKKSVNTDNLFTQEDLNEKIQKRLARQEAAHEAELAALQEKTKGLLDPAKLKEYEQKVEELQTESQATKNKLTREYELKLAATAAGVKDPEYFEFLAQKEKLYDRLKATDEGTVAATDEQGNLLTGEDGKQLGPQTLINKLKEDKPDLFVQPDDNKGDSEPKQTPGPTTPGIATGSEVGEIGKRMAEREEPKVPAYDPWKKEG